jgi:hypothetical protein
MPRSIVILPEYVEYVLIYNQFGDRIAMTKAKLAATCHAKAIRKNMSLLNLCKKEKITQPFPFLFY